MSLILRAAKGSQLTEAEVDANFTHCSPTSGTTQANLDLKQPLHANLTAEAGLTGAADRVSYYTGVGAKALATLTSFGRSIIAAVDLAALKTILALVKADVGLGSVDNTSDATKLAATISALLSQNNTYTKAQRGAFVALTSTAASIAVDLNLSNNFNHTLTENTTLAAPTNVVAGQSGVIHFTQHASAAKTLAFDAFWYFGAATDTISTTLGAKCAMSYIIEPGATRALCTLGGDLA